MLKYCKDDIVYYFDTQEYLEKGVAQPFQQYRAMEMASIVLNRRTQQVIKARTGIEHILDFYLDNQK
jgi:hypothetical protein